MDKAALKKWAIVLGLGIVIWFCPVPAGLSPAAWKLFAVFVATIAGFILQPIPMGAVAFLSLTLCAFFGILKTKDALMGFGNGTIWLIVCAFFLSRGFIKTGLGRRIAFCIIRAIGKSAASLGYSICLAELVISPAMPSATARGGGVFYPIVQSLSSAFESEPGPSAGRIGKYLMQVGFHADAVTCMMFLTSMAGNPLCVGLAASAVGVELTWMEWAVAAIVPGLVCLFLVPLVLLRIAPPELRQIPNARQIARDELEKMGPMSRDELVLAFVFLMCLVLWATGSLTGLGATPIAMLAVSIMLIAKVLTWKDILAEKGAWDAMFWMGGLMALATALSKSGFIKWTAAFIADGIAEAHMGWISSFLIISLIYVYSHYCFASVTARISAMYAAFVAVAAACGAPALMVAVAFGIFANLPISLTHYGNGAAPVYFGAGYVSQSEWWRNGFIICTINTVVWLTVGMAWWKLIGLYLEFV